MLLVLPGTEDDSQQSFFAGFRAVSLEPSQIQFYQPFVGSPKVTNLQVNGGDLDFLNALIATRMRMTNTATADDSHTIFVSRVSTCAIGPERLS